MDSFSPTLVTLVTLCLPLKGTLGANICLAKCLQCRGRS